MDREMWILRQLETSLTASAEALAERLQVSPRTSLTPSTRSTGCWPLRRPYAPPAAVTASTFSTHKNTAKSVVVWSAPRTPSTTRVIAAHRSSESCCLPNTR